MKNDAPISEKKHDLLERYNFAQEIVTGLIKSFQNGQPSIAVGINGEWGSGKSSLLEFIKQEIALQTDKESTKTIVIDFNPWIFSGQADLQTAFLLQLGRELGAIYPELKKLGDDIAFFASLLEIPNSFNPELLSKGVIGSSLKGVQKIIKKFNKQPTLKQLKNKIDEELDDTKIKVFVFIDDIDRLIPNEVLEILRLVKLNANFKNTFFVLAYDKDVIVKSINSKIKIDGERFLEKIIQIDYTLPKITLEKLEELFLSNLELLSKDLDFKFDRSQLGRIWKNGWENGLSSYYTNLRNIYRFTNAFSIRFNCIRENINVIDFIAIESIRLFDFNIYEWLFNNKNEVVIGRDDSLEQMLSENKKPFLDRLKDNPQLSLLNAKDNTINIINYIFNSIHLPIISFSAQEINKTQTEKDKRAIHPDYFDHYFTFRISDGNIPQSVIDSFLLADDQQKEEVLDRYQKSHFEAVLTGISYSMNKINVDQHFYEFFLNYSDSRNLEESQLGEFKSNGLNLILSMLNAVSKQYGFELYFNEINKSKDSYSRFYLLALLKNRTEEKMNYDSVKDFPDEIINGKEAKIKQSFTRALRITSERYLNSPFLHSYFSINDFLKTLFENDKARYSKYISQYLHNDDTSILLFICSLTVSSMGGTASYFIQNEHHMLPEMTIDKLDERLSIISVDNYKGHNKEFLEVFYKLKSIEFRKYVSYTIDLKEVRL